jgi:hypothetical protein
MSPEARVSELDAMLAELAEITHCRPGTCHLPEGMICVGDDYLWLRDETPSGLYEDGRLWLGCEGRQGAGSR